MDKFITINIVDKPPSRKTDTQTNEKAQEVEHGVSTVKEQLK